MTEYKMTVDLDKIKIVLTRNSENTLETAVDWFTHDFDPESGEFLNEKKVADFIHGNEYLVKKLKEMIDFIER